MTYLTANKRVEIVRMLQHMLLTWKDVPLPLKSSARYVEILFVPYFADETGIGRGDNAVLEVFHEP